MLNGLTDWMAGGGRAVPALEQQLGLVPMLLVHNPSCSTGRGSKRWLPIAPAVTCPITICIIHVLCNSPRHFYASLVVCSSRSTRPPIFACPPLVQCRLTRARTPASRALGGSEWSCRTSSQPQLWGRELAVGRLTNGMARSSHGRFLHQSTLAKRQCRSMVCKSAWRTLKFPSLVLLGHFLCIFLQLKIPFS